MRRFVQPRRAAGRMRKHDHIERSARPACMMDPPDNFGEHRIADQLLSGERTDGDDHLRGEEGDLAIEVRGAPGDLDRIGDAIAAALLFAWKTTDHRAHVHAAPKIVFRHPELREPAEHPPAGRVSKRTPIFDLVRTGRLPDQHDLGVSNSAGHRLSEYIRTGATGVERFDVPREIGRASHRTFIQKARPLRRRTKQAMLRIDLAVLETAGLLSSGRAIGSPAASQPAQFRALR